MVLEKVKIKTHLSFSPWIVLLSLFHLLGLNSSAGSNQPSSSSSNSNFLERAQKRAASRWTLSEWLAQKEKNKLMDMWLAMNSPSPYEFMLGAANNNYEKITTETPSQKQTIYSFCTTQIHNIRLDKNKLD